MNSLSESVSTQTLAFSTDAEPMGVLANVPPFIPGYKSLPDNVAGVNRNMVKGDQDGLLGYIFPYLNMESTDEIRVYLGTRIAPVVEFFLVGEYVNQLVPFHIPTDILEEMYKSPTPVPGVLELHFTSKRPSGNETKSPPLPLLYKPFGPGELDTRPDLPNNQGLALPNPSETVIDKNVIDNGMYVTVPKYEHQAIGDVVYLAVGPLILTMTVIELGDQVLELTPAFLAVLPNTDKVALSYEVWDIVENGSGWSSPVFLALKPTETLLAAPVIDQAEPGSPDNLNYDNLSDLTATVVLNESFLAGDIVMLTIGLTTAAGDQVSRVIKHDVIRSTRSLRIELENEFVQNGIRGSMILNYTRKRVTATLSSKSYTVTISGLALPAAAPTIVEQKDNELPSDTVLAHVNIPKYWPLVDDAIVNLYWQVTGADGVNHLYIFSQVIDDATRPVIFTVSSQYIERFENSPLTVFYKIEHFGKPMVQSASLRITIGTARELKAPMLVQASPGNRIEPLRTEKAATVRISDPAMNSNKTYTLSVRGRPGFGSPVLAPKKGNDSGELLFDLPLTAIPANIGTYDTFSYTITESGKPDRPSALLRYEVMPVTDASLKYPQMSITEASDNILLNLNSFPGDAHWSLPRYLFMAIGTRMRVLLSGQKSDGSEYVIMLFEGVITANHVSTGLNGIIDRAKLKLFKDGTQVYGLSIANFSDQGGADTFFPTRELTIQTEMLTEPVILQLIDEAPPILGQVVNGGSTDDTRPRLIGTGTPGSQVILKKNSVPLVTLTVGPNGIWNEKVDLGLGKYTLTATTVGSTPELVSAPWVVTVIKDYTDFTSFESGLNGWAQGPASHSAKLQWGMYVVDTPSGNVNHSGELLLKHHPLISGATYHFSCHVLNFAVNGYDVDPRLLLRVDALLDTGAITIPKHAGWRLLQGTFVAGSSGTAIFRIFNIEHRHIGNDFYLDHLQVKQISNGTKA